MNIADHNGQIFPSQRRLNRTRMDSLDHAKTFQPASLAPPIPIVIFKIEVADELGVPLRLDGVRFGQLDAHHHAGVIRHDGGCVFVADAAFFFALGY